MMWRRICATLLTAALLTPQALTAEQAGAAAGQGQPRGLFWSELKPLLVDKRVAIPLPGGVRIEGRVLAVRTGELIMDVRKTSNRSVYPKGQHAIPRAAVTSLRVITTEGPMKLLGGFAGAVGGIMLIFLGVYHESATLALLALLLGIPVGAWGGYHAGKAADREVTEILLLPDAGERLTAP